MRISPDIQKSTVRMSGAELDLAKSFEEISNRHELTLAEEMHVLAWFTARIAREALTIERTTNGVKP